MLSEEIQNEINKAVDAVMEKFSKSVDTVDDDDDEANGGGDKIKSGSPGAKKQSEVKKSEENEEEKITEIEDPTNNTKMKKSLEELSEILSKDEVELIAAWRDDQEEEGVTKSRTGLSDNSSIEKIVKSAISEATEGLKKSLEAKDDIIKSLEAKVDKIASAPAYDKKSVENIEPIEKSKQNDDDKFTKSQVINTMLELQKSGKGVTSYHISEYEATNNITNQTVKNTVIDELKKAN